MPDTSSPRAELGIFLKVFVFLLKILHWVLVGFALVGWLATSAPWLLAYLIYVPLMVIHWSFNENSCIVNNFETWLMTGKWRNQHNPEEGAFVRTALIRVIGWAPPEKAFDIFIRLLMIATWSVAYLKWRGI